MLSVAVVGCGAIADAHAWAIQSIKDCRIVAACDAEPLMVEQFAERFGVELRFTGLDQMLRDARPDVVHILTPPQTHYPIAKQCLNNGCHTYVEKPFTLFVDEAEELVALAGKKKLKLTVGHDALFSPAAREMRRLVESGYLGGSAVHMESYYGYEFGDTYGNALLTDKNHWVRKLPGKLLQNIISHGIARVAEFITGDDPQVIAHGFASPLLQRMGEEEIIDELRVIIDGRAGATAYFTFSSQMRPTLNQFRVYGPRNGLFLDEGQQSVIRLPGTRHKSYAEKFVPQASFSAQYLGNFWRNLRLFMGNNFHLESGKKHLAQSFYSSIADGTPDPIPGQKILLVARIMDQIFRQIKLGQASPQPLEFHAASQSVGA